MDDDLAALQRAARAAPGDAEVRVRLAHAYAQAGRPAEAWLTWRGLEREPPAAVTEAAFAAQEDTLRGLVGWARVSSREADGFVDPQELLRTRRPLVAANLTGGLGWGAEDALEAVARIETLMRLAIPCDEADPPLELLTRLPRLEELTLSGERVDDASLEPLARMPSLRSLTLECPRLRDGWPGWLAASGVTRLAGQMPEMGDDGLVALARVGSLRALTLQCGEAVGDVGLAALAGLGELRSLYLFLREQVRGSFLAAFAAHPLEELFLAGGTLDPSELRVLARLPALRELALPTVDNPLLAALAGAPALTTLRFDHWSSELDDDGVAALAGCARLRVLRLGWSSGVTGVGFMAWGPGLVELQGGAGIDDAGARAIARIDTLEVVDLEHAERLTDEGLAALAELPRLRALTISGEVTDAGLRALHAHPALAELTIKEGITGPYLTEGALDALVAATPGLEVFRQGFY